MSRSSLSYSCLGESPRWQGRWRDQTRAHSNSLFLDQQPSTASKEFWAPVATCCPLCIDDGNLQMQMFIERKRFHRKRWLMHQKEANKHYLALIRWLDHLGDWTPYSRNDTKCQNWPKLAFKRPDSHFWLIKKKRILYSKSAFQIASGKCESKALKQKVKKWTP